MRLIVQRDTPNVLIISWPGLCGATVAHADTENTSSYITGGYVRGFDNQCQLTIVKPFKRCAFSLNS